MRTAICFDLDDTLLDRAAALDRFLAQLHHRYDLGDVPPDALRSRFYELDRSGHADRGQLFGALVAEFALPAPPRRLALEFRRTWRDCAPRDGAPAVLAELRSRGHPLAIITNGAAATQRAKLRGSGLDALVDLALISGEERLRKPDPAIFARAAARLGLPPSACLFVGDDPHADIAGATSAGFAAVWLRRGRAWPADLPPLASAVIDELAELLGLELVSGARGV